MMTVTAVPMTVVAVTVMATIIVTMAAVIVITMVMATIVMIAIAVIAAAVVAAAVVSVAMACMTSDRGISPARVPVSMVMIRLWQSFPIDPRSRVVIVPRTCCAHISCFPAFLKKPA